MFDFTIASGDLDPTLTYARRSWCWLSNGTGEAVIERTGEVIPCLGLLTIKLQPAATGWGRKIEVDTYAVQEAEPDRPGVRMFVLLNVHDREQPEPYRVTVGGLNRCRCQAGKCRVPSGCKHRDAVTACIEAGVLEPAGELLNI